MSQSQNLNVFVPEIPSMNQRQHWLTEMICMNTSQRIMEVDGQGEPKPSLLESCSLSREGNTLRIQIKKDIPFQDGKVLSVDDVISSLVLAATVNSE